MQTKITHTALRYTDKERRIAIVTNCCDDWGGSEELWAKSIPYLQEEGCKILVLKDRINRKHPKYVNLSKKGVLLKDLANTSKPALIKHFLNKLWKYSRKETPSSPLYSAFKKSLVTYKPHLVIISQGINFDGLKYAYRCALSNINYVIVSQKAVEFYWPPARKRSLMLTAFQQAKKCFFVSHHNKCLTEEQFGIRFKNAEVIFNPVEISTSPVKYPSFNKGIRLACVARLFIIDKGQDILLRILAENKWRERPVTVSFIGSGVDEEGLRSMAALLNVNNIEFKGYAENMQNLWQHYHALILPSRSEGLPLVIMEAMAAGRPVIVSRAGGNAELVEEGVTGFIGEANTEAFEQTMERAWNMKDQWENMGEKAFDFIKKHVPRLPEKDFANALTQILHEQ